MDKIIEISLYGLIFVLPFSKTLVEAFFILSLVCWVLKRVLLMRSPVPAGGNISTLKAFRPTQTPLNIPILWFVLLSFLSVICSKAVILSFKGFFFKLFEWVMLYFITAETINSEVKVKKVLAAMLASLSLLALDGVFQGITGTDIIRRQAMHGYRISASFSSPNGFAALLVFMIPVITGIIYAGEKIFKKIPALYTRILNYVLILCLFFTYSRGAWIALIAAMLFLSILENKKILLLIALITFALALFVFGYIVNSGYIVKIQEASTSLRICLWHEALAIIEDFPVLGCGPNTYAHIGPYYSIGGGGSYPHNSYLHMAAESGLLVLGSFIWIVSALFRIVVRNIKTSRYVFNRAVLAGLLAGLFGFLIHSFVDTNIYALQSSILMWFSMGLIMAVNNIDAGKRS